MKNKLIGLMFFTITITGYAQIKFEKGYFINNSNQRVECLINNKDWKDNPEQFKYKIQEHDKSIIKHIKSIKEFGVYDYSKYQRFSVNMDRSSNNIATLSKERAPLFKKETLFLKVLMQGDANLYMYEDGNLRRYFYKTKTVNLEQLVFKQYLIIDGAVAKNEMFKQQLWTNLKCDNLLLKNIKNINYNKKDLTKIFLKYNECGDTKIEEFKIKEKRDLFNFSLQLGVNSSSLSIRNIKEVNFDKEIGFRYGVDLEFVLPFNKNKWAIFAEPTYQSYKTEKEIISKTTLTITRIKTFKVDYKSIEVPIGVRYYHFLNDNSKIFVNAAYIIDFSLNSKIERTTDLEIAARTTNFTFGLGYKYKNKFSLELRAYSNRDVLSNYLNWSSEYKNTALILGYTIF